MKTLQTVCRFSLQPCARSASNRVAGNNQLQPLQFDGLKLLSGMLKIDVFVTYGFVIVFKQLTAVAVKFSRVETILQMHFRKNKKAFCGTICKSYISPSFVEDTLIPDISGNI